MALYLINPAVDLTLELHVAPEAEEAMSIQWERTKDRSVRDTFVKKLESHFERVLAECLDWDIKPPTPAQLSYATIVARKLKVPLPHEARLYRMHTALFLETYADKLKTTK